MESKKLSNGGLQTMKGGSIGNNLNTNEVNETLYPTGMQIAGGGHTDVPRINELQRQVEAAGGLLPNFSDLYQLNTKRNYADVKKGAEKPMFPAGINPDTFCNNCD